MLAVNIVEVMKRIQIRRTTDRRTERQTERQTDGQTEERRTDRRQDNVNHSIPQNTSINSAYMYLNVSGGYTHMRLNKIYILNHVQHMLQTLRPVDLILGMALIIQMIISVYIRQNMNNKVTSNCRRNWAPLAELRHPWLKKGHLEKQGVLMWRKHMLYRSYFGHRFDGLIKQI